MSPLRDGIDPLPPLFECRHQDIDESAGMAEQDAFCTQDDQCRALADAHEPDCPVERRLREELGF